MYVRLVTHNMTGGACSQCLVSVIHVILMAFIHEGVGQRRRAGQQAHLT